MNIGKTVRLCRNIKHFTQKQLAKKSAISLSHLCLVENNNCSITVDKLKNIAKALNIPLSILIYLASDKDDLTGLDENLLDKLSANILKLIS